MVEEEVPAVVVLEEEVEEEEEEEAHEVLTPEEETKVGRFLSSFCLKSSQKINHFGTPAFAFGMQIALWKARSP